MKNFVQSGVNITVVAPANVTSGQGLRIGQLFGVCAETANMGDDVDLQLEGVFDLLAKTTHVFAVGDPVYWDDDTHSAASAQDADSNSAGANEACIGVAIAAKGAGSAVVRAKLCAPVALV